MGAKMNLRLITKNRTIDPEIGLPKKLILKSFDREAVFFLNIMSIENLNALKIFKLKSGLFSNFKIRKLYKITHPTV